MADSSSRSSKPRLVRFANGRIESEIATQSVFTTSSLANYSGHHRVVLPVGNATSWGRKFDRLLTESDVLTGLQGIFNSLASLCLDGVVLIIDSVDHKTVLWPVSSRNLDTFGPAVSSLSRCQISDFDDFFSRINVPVICGDEKTRSGLVHFPSDQSFEKLKIKEGSVIIDRFEYKGQRKWFVVYSSSRKRLKNLHQIQVAAFIASLCSFLVSANNQSSDLLSLCESFLSFDFGDEQAGMTYDEKGLLKELGSLLKGEEGY